MANSIVKLPTGYFPDPDRGRPLWNAKIYIGEPDLDPRIFANQKTVTGRREDGTEIALAQPIRTNNGGVPIDGSSNVVVLLVDGAYSMAVDDRQDNQKYYFDNVLEGAPVTFDILGLYTRYPFNTLQDAISGTLSDGLTTVDLQVGDFIVTNGSTAINDGRGADYVVVSAGTGTDDGYTYIDLDNGNQLNLIAKITVENISGLQALTGLSENTVIMTEGATNRADGGNGLWYITSDTDTANQIVIESDDFIRPGEIGFYGTVPASQILETSYITNGDGVIIRPLGPTITAAQFGLDPLLTNISSQSCSANFARSGNFLSIFSSCEGNTSANVAARLCYSKVAQSVNLGSEDCDSITDRTGNLNTKVGLAEGVGATNVAARRAKTSANDSGQIGCDSVLLGDGAGARLQPVVVGGVITAINVLDGGGDYQVTPTILIQDKSNVGSGASATANMLSNSIDSVTVDNGGSNYPDDDLILVVRAEVADQQLFAGASTLSQVRGTNSSILSSHLIDFDPNCENATTLSSEGCSVAGLDTAIIGSNISTINGSKVIIGGSRASETSSDTQDSAIIASDTSTITTGDTSSIVSSTNTDITGSLITSIGSSNCTVTSDGSTILNGNESTIPNENAILIGRRVSTASDRTFVIGDSASGSASTANRTFEIDMLTGNTLSAGTFTPGHTFTDYAEYFENLEKGVIGPGEILTLEGDKVRIAKDGDEILGVVSNTACIRAGDSWSCWAGRYKKTDYGEIMYDEVDMINYKTESGYYSGPVSEAPETPASAKYYTELHPIESDDYNPEKANIPRSERPEEWTLVGMLGQVYVNISKTCIPGDYIGPTGEKSESKTKIKVMKITSEKDSYNIAKCLIC